MRIPWLQLDSDHSGMLLAVMRYAVAAALLAVAIMFLIALPARSEHLKWQATVARSVFESQMNEPGSITALLAFYLPGALMLETVVMGMYLLNALLIFRLRSDDWQALLTSAGLATFALHIIPTLNSWMTAHPELAVIGTMMKSIGLGLAFLFLYLLPGGYFAPAWIRYFVYLWVGWSVLWLLYPGSFFDFRDPYSIKGGGFVALMSWWIISVFTQVYRYRYASSVMERQQSKYIFFGATFVFVGYSIYVPLRDMMPGLPRPELAVMLFELIAPYVFVVMVAVIPVTIALSILRYRLFDIDLIIRKTLVYAGLTGLLGVVYFSSVVLLQVIFSASGDERSPLAIVFSTLGIAALFSPLRTRLQAGIDRRFYRSKYDAEIALARFEEQVRNEVDLERLCTHLTNAVGETVQPVAVTIWLSASQVRSDSPDRGRK